MQFRHSPGFVLSRQIKEIEDPETPPDERSPTLITSPTLPLIKQSGFAPSVLVAGIFFSHLSSFPAPFSEHITGVCNYILIFILKEKELTLPNRADHISSVTCCSPCSHNQGSHSLFLPYQKPQVKLLV